MLKYMPDNMRTGKSIPMQELVSYGSFLEVGNLNIHVWEMGSGYPVVLLHGFTATSYDWRFNIPELAKEFSVHAPDLPGFGYSQKPLDFKYDDDGYAEFMRSFLESRNIQKAVLAGNSLGGQVALNTCIRHPERVSGLVLIDAGGYPASMEFPPFKLMAAPVLGDIMMRLTSRFVIRQVLARAILYDSSFATNEVISDYYNVYLTANARKIPPVVVRNMTGDKYQTPEMWKAIKCPVLIIWGEEDKVIPVKWAERFHRDIPGSSLLIIPRAGHMPHVEKAEIVNKAIADFVRKIQ
jgi:pimeloyl-ACP methyl ester carboxylesterase